MGVVESKNEQYQAWFRAIRRLIHDNFVKEDHKTNAEVLLQGIKSKNFDKTKYVQIIKEMDDTEWSVEYVTKKLKELDEIIGITTDFLKKQAVTEIRTEKELKELKWALMKRIVLDYAKFSKETYDILLYSEKNYDSTEKDLLMVELLRALKIINTSSNNLIKRYEHEKYHHTRLKKFLNQRLQIEHILLRMYNILFNMESKPKKIKHYTKILNKELIEYTLEHKDDF